MGPLLLLGLLGGGAAVALAAEGAPAVHSGEGASGPLLPGLVLALTARASDRGLVEAPVALLPGEIGFVGATFTDATGAAHDLAAAVPFAVDLTSDDDAVATVVFGLPNVVARGAGTTTIRGEYTDPATGFRYAGTLALVVAPAAVTGASMPTLATLKRFGRLVLAELDTERDPAARAHLLRQLGQIADAVSALEPDAVMVSTRGAGCIFNSPDQLAAYLDQVNAAALSLDSDITAQQPKLLDVNGGTMPTGWPANWARWLVQWQAFYNANRKDGAGNFLNRFLHPCDLETQTDSQRADLAGWRAQFEGLKGIPSGTLPQKGIVEQPGVVGPVVEGVTSLFGAAALLAVAGGFYYLVRSRS